MGYFPVFLDLSGRRCLVVGGDDAAAAKAALLHRAGAEVAVIAETPCPALRDAMRRGAATHLAGHFSPPLLDGVALVMVAGETLAVSEAVALAARQHGIPVNVMDDARLCSFIMPAIVDRSPVTIAISTGGTSPLLASLLRQWLDHVLPRRLGGLAALAGHCRELVRRRLRDGIERRRFWEEILTGETARLALDGNIAAADAALQRALEERAHPPNHAAAAA
jgi:uroporphyrin-III C-methyltransferase / precorrin-2 dehydrogenase / sirohydrochlorin ferrochelatase